MHQLSSVTALSALALSRMLSHPIPSAAIPLIDPSSVGQSEFCREQQAHGLVRVFPGQLRVSSANSTGLEAGQGNWGWGVKYPVMILPQGKASVHGRAGSRRCPELCSHLQWGTSCETCRWDGAVFISGHVWWSETQNGPSLDMANTTWASGWVLSTAWMHKESLSFLKSS